MLKGADVHRVEFGTMRITWCVVAAAVVVVLTTGTDVNRVDYTGSVVLRVIPKFKEELTWLHALRQDVHVDIWRGASVLSKPVVIRIGSKEKENGIKKYLDGMRMEYSVLSENLQSVINEVEERIFDRTRQNREAGGTFDFQNYHPLDEIVDFLKELAVNRSTVTYTEIGATYEGRKIPSVILSTAPGKPLIYLDCTIHAREWLATSTCTYIINELVTKYGTDTEVTQLLDRFDWQFTPVANPDGYVYTWETDRLWRQNRAPIYNESCMGVDLNRNFDDHFGGLGSSDDPCNNEYHGPSPFSEKETQAMRDVFVSNQGRMQAAISIHTYSQYWMMPYAFSTDLPPQYEEMNRVMQKGVTALQDTYGTKYENGTVANTIYFASGSSTDWVYDVIGVPYSYTLELRDTNSFVLPPEQILPTAIETWNGIKAATLAMKVRDFKRSSCLLNKKE